MKVIISPAKKMQEQPDSLDWRNLPAFLPRTQQLLAALRSMSAADLQKLWKCNNSIAELNVQRLAHMDLHSNLTPAVLAYVGIQYQYLSPEAFTNQQMAYVQDHLRILSGFYGLLRPMDGVTPYRLEMQAKLSVDGQKDLYDFWGDSLAQALFEETDCIINLASKEYSQCVSRHLPKHVQFVTCVFGERKGGKIIEKGTMCKMARGEMVRFMAENALEKPDELRAFDRLDYAYSAADSTGDTLVFVREEKPRISEW
ncbi:MAG: peroxide stress protein YaaA [bacterium]|nr:peroxide stress protein YaaA [bacterium]